MVRALILLVGALLTVPGSTPAQEVRAGRHPEAGRPVIRNYPPEEYGGGGQNWTIVQDHRGVMYVGSANGVLEYDGVTWRLILTPNRGTVRSLAIGGDGRVYAGAVSEFGYLAPDATGEMQFVSLMDQVPEDARQIGDVWRTHVLPDGVYFQAEAAIFRWADGGIRVWKPGVRFNRSSAIDGRLYVPQPDLGLTVLEGDTFRVLPGTERVGNEVFSVVLPYGERRLLVGTRADGLFLYDGATLVPFPTEVDALIKSANLYRGVAMPDGSFALTTTTAGMTLIDRQGRRLEVLDKDLGLDSNIVYYAMADRAGALWLGRQGGLSRVETPSPVSFFGEEDGLEAGPVAIVRHDGRLYVASGLGVFYLRTSGGRDLGEFVQVQGVRNQVWWFARFEDPAANRPPELLVAGSDGLYRIEGDRAFALKAPADGTFRASVLLQSRFDPKRVWVGLFDGLAAYRWRDGQWLDEGRLDGVSDQVRTLHENPDGSLWLGTQATGVLRVTFQPGTAPGTPPWDGARVERFGVEHGLVPGGVFINPVGGAPFFLVGGDNPFVARFDDASGTFVREPAFDVAGINLRSAGFGLQEGPDGRVFVNFGRETVVMEKGPDGVWAADRATFSRFGDQGAFTLYAEPDGVVWFQMARRLVRFEASQVSGESSPLTVLVRRVTTDQTHQLYGGAGDTTSPPRLAPSLSALRFEFASPSFQANTSIEYQSRLEGFEGDWSAWSSETRRDFTNLGFGDYRFLVRARNPARQMSDEAQYAFTIMAPWYRTWWAYGVYVLLLGAAVVAVDRIQRRRLIGKERERAQFTEARLRAEAAEAVARSESERKKNVELLSEIGREITASLDFDTIFYKLYERVNELADADVFGVGLFHPDRREIEYRLAIEEGKRYAPYTRDTSNPNQFPVWCIEHRQPILINDVATEASRYISGFDDEVRPLEDGTMSRQPQSLIYLPLVSKDRVLGIITIQSFEKHAYTEHHLNLLQSLASYTTIALDNADAYRQLNEQEHEIRRLFEEAERARAAAEEADAAKSAFLSTVSHELRTPLTSVLGFAKIIKKRLEERLFPLIQTDDKRTRQTMQQVEENLRVVVSEGERLTKLIDDVLDLAKIEAGKLEWHMDTVGLAEVIDQATSATSSLFDQKGLRLVREVDPDLPSVIGDRDRLVQVVINLISNAVKFTDAGSVTCRAVRDEDAIVVSVIDTGMGISASDQPKVFERFKQVGDTLTDKPKGTGLGLPICKEIVEHHGGRLWLESEPGRGSTFSFTVPVAVAAVAGAAPRQGPIELAALIRQLRDRVEITTPRPTTREPRILVVDDDPNIRELLNQEFSEAGYSVRLAANGREALAAIRQERPDLVVLDVMMPEINGFDVAAVLKNDPLTLDIPIVILSIVQDLDRGYRLGVDRYLTKPIDTDLLFREVETLLEQGASHKRVLVVDEDASTVKTLSDVLQARGYSVSETNGHDLKARAMALQPDIIMLSTAASAPPEVVQMLRFEKGLENVLFLVYE